MVQSTCPQPLQRNLASCASIPDVLFEAAVPPGMGVSYTDPDPYKLIRDNTNKVEPCPDCGGSGRVVLFTSEEPCTRCCPS